MFAAATGGPRPRDLRGLRVRRLPLPATATRAERERAALGANDRLSDALDAEGPFELVYERHALWSYAAMEYARERGIPGLLEVNAPLVQEQATHRGLVDPAGAAAVARRAFEAASSVLAVSEGVANALAGTGLERPVHVVPNAVDPGRFRPRARRDAKRPFTVGFVGTLKPWHGLETLVTAFAYVHALDPSSRLLVVGDGPGRKRLEADLEEYGLAGAAILTGAVSPTSVPAYVASMDVGVAPYPALDGFYFSPLKVYEYMAAGVPPVTSRLGQLTQLVDDGVTGFLCPPGDAAAFAERIDLLRRDPELRLRIGAAARRAVGEHSWDAVAGRIVELAGLNRSGVVAGRA
jgi:glycosyltransferase involved in cell wall biosynthesis